MLGRSVVAGSTFKDALQVLADERIGGLTADEHLMIENAEYFEQRQTHFENNYKHQWVAVHRGKVYHEKSLRQLQMALASISDGKYAYIVQIL
jgi:hypothetical protein